MSNRFYYDECAEEIFDSKIEDYPATADICSILNKQEVIIDKYKEEVKKLNVGIAHLKNQLKQAKEKLAEKDERIAELEKEVKEKDELIKQLGSDKVLSTEQAKQIAREVQLKVMKENIEIIYATIRRDVYDKIETMLEEDSEWYEDNFYTKMPLNDILRKIEKLEQGEE